MIGENEMKKEKLVKPTYLSYSYGCGFDVYDVDSEEIFVDSLSELMSEIEEYMEIGIELMSCLPSFEEKSDECNVDIILYDEEGDFIKYGDTLIFKNDELIDKTHEQYNKLFKNVIKF